MVDILYYYFPGVNLDGRTQGTPARSRAFCGRARARHRRRPMPGTLSVSIKPAATGSRRRFCSPAACPDDGRQSWSLSGDLEQAADSAEAGHGNGAPRAVAGGEAAATTLRSGDPDPTRSPVGRSPAHVATAVARVGSHQRIRWPGQEADGCHADSGWSGGVSFRMPVSSS